jgi:hypothetical protein
MPLFRCYQDTVHRTCVIELSDEAVVKHARAVAEGSATDRVGIEGKVIKEQSPYNKPWSWHLDPNSIEFFYNAPEVSDASVVFMEEHLGEVGGTFLPRSIWCPWNSRVIEEVFPDAEGLSTLLKA